MLKFKNALSAFTKIWFALQNPNPKIRRGMAQAARLNLRLQKELKLLLADPPPAASFPSLSDASSLTSIDALLQGPEGSVYAHGVFKIKIQIPERYPFQPPIVTFATPIYHPNIDNGGRICLDILNLPPKGTWQPSLNISTVLTSIGLLLNEPNPDDGLMHEASREYKYNRQAFDQNARFLTQKYARAGKSEGTEGRQGNPSHSCPSTEHNELEGPNPSVCVTKHFAYHEESSESSSKPCSSICEEPTNDCLMNTRKKLSLSTSAVSHSHNGKIPSSDLPNQHSYGLENQTLNKDFQTSSPSMVPVDTKHVGKVSKSFTGSSTDLRLKKPGLVGLKSSSQHLEKEKENLHPVQCILPGDESAAYKKAGKQIVVDLQKPGGPHPKLLHMRNNIRSEDYVQNLDLDFVDEFGDKLGQCNEEGRVRVESTIVLDSEDSEEENTPVRSKALRIAKRCLTRKRKSSF